ncbi:MAG: hypothetical protein QXD51_03600, partial [Candidatus Anstonellales archaeon]
YFSRKWIVKLAGMDLKPFAVALAIYLIALCIGVNGINSLPVVAAGFALGTLANLMRVERTSLMGAVIFPTLVRMVF